MSTIQIVFGEKLTQKSEPNPYQKVCPKRDIAKVISNTFHAGQIYEALEKDDPAEVVIATMDVLKKTTPFDFKTQPKSEELSNMHRKQGNDYYSVKRFRRALECYNKALLFAPDNSQAMKFAYSNRSALLFTLKTFTACIKDIDIFFSMGCTEPKLVQRLRLRKKDCLMNAWIENMQEVVAGDFLRNFFKFDVKLHPQIPCASNDVEVILENGLPKIVAAKDIPIGKLVAVESPFAGELDEDNYYISCHYCHRYSLNLIPCEGCTVALFCDDDCKNKCKKEYHNIECKIINYPNRLISGPATNMNLRAALKMKQMCKSWKELITASHNIGEDRMRNSSISDIFDVKSKFSLLCNNNPSHFIHGERYNQSFVCGMDLHALANLPSFFPKEVKERDAAIRALARIMLHLYSSYRKLEVYNTALDIYTEKFTTNTDHNYGLYSFTAKLKHECDSNLIHFGVKNKVALVTVRPIKKGDELTISFLGHYYENLLPNREYRLFCFTQEICRCHVCVEKYSVKHSNKTELPPEKIRLFNSWARGVTNWEENEASEDDKVFHLTCATLTAFQGLECTREHRDVFREFRKFTSFCQYSATKNQFMQKDDEPTEIFYP